FSQEVTVGRREWFRTGQQGPSGQALCSSEVKGRRTRTLDIDRAGGTGAEVHQRSPALRSLRPAACRRGHEAPRLAAQEGVPGRRRPSPSWRVALAAEAEVGEAVHELADIGRCTRRKQRPSRPIPAKTSPWRRERVQRGGRDRRPVYRRAPPMLPRLCRRLFGRPSFRRPHRLPLRLEVLEDRTLLTAYTFVADPPAPVTVAALDSNHLDLNFNP